MLAVLLIGAGGGLAVGLCLSVLWSRSRTADPAAEQRASVEVASRASEAAVVRESLDRLHDQLHDMAQHGVSWQSQLKQHVEDVRSSTEVLRRETATLSTALRKPQVRGRWGELHLRRVVEIAGMVERCDFEEQVTVRTAGGGETAQRPDLVVNLAGGKHVVIDAKVPLEAFLDATDAESDPDRAHHLARHSRQLRQHVDALASKAYWRALSTTPEFVVLFVPAESFLSAALEADASLLEYAAERKVVLATPTTLVALLRTVAYAWTQQTLADQTREVHEIGRDLHERLATMASHLDRVGRSLSSAVTAYNRAVGSLENRVLVSARRFTALGVSSTQLDAPGTVKDTARQLSAPELLEAVAESRPELPELLLQDPRGGAAEVAELPPVRRVAP